VITVLREAHQAVEEARSRGQPALDAGLLKGLRERYDTAVAFGIIHNRLRDWDGDGNHPGYTLGCWLREHADQVWLFTTALQVEWTSNDAAVPLGGLGGEHVGRLGHQLGLEVAGPVAERADDGDIQPAVISSLSPAVFNV